MKSINFRGHRTDLEVYHLAYGTKKLRACTYRRMEKRQKKRNERLAKFHIAKSPFDQAIKAEKAKWLGQI